MNNSSRHMRLVRHAWIKRAAMLAVVLLCAACAPVKHDPVRIPPAKIGDQHVKYPVKAIRLRHEGTVTLIMLVNTTGHVAEVRVEQSSGYLELDQTAVDTARDWLFTPGTIDGVPYPSYVREPINFHLLTLSPPPLVASPTP
nr:energy transducer TonB [Dyella soli]